MIALMKDAAKEALSHAISERGYYNVTRNLINSLAVGGYYKGNLVFIVGANEMGLAPAKRPSLAYGQKGKTEFGKWFTADDPDSHGRQNGRSLAKETLRGMHPAKRATYTLIMVAPMEYAEWVEKIKGHNVLSRTLREMPEIVKEVVYYNPF